MTFEPINVSLDEGCFSAFVRRYHFKESDKKEIIKLYRQLSPRIHAEFHYVTESSDSGEKTALVVLTLGQAFDEFQESLLKNGDIQKAYIADCISLEIMSLAYAEIDKKLLELTGLYAGSYVFEGSDELPLSEMPALMKKLGQTLVTYNDAFALIPKKSVVFKTVLHKEKQERHSRCRSCSARNCSLRQEDYAVQGVSSEPPNDSVYDSNADNTFGMNAAEKGLVHLYTGDGKGKTTAAIGLAVRAAGAGRRVVFSQFMKSGNTSELAVLSGLSEIKIIRNNNELGWFKKDDEESAALFTGANNEILDRIIDVTDAGECDVLVMDEITYPYRFGIIDKKKLERLIAEKPEGLEIVMTGREADSFFYEHADYITDMKKVKHPFDEGIEARFGIEY